MDKYTTPRNSSGITIEPQDYNALVSHYCPTCNTLPQRLETNYPQSLTNECFICHKKSYLGTRMPYPSRYDGEWVCGECVRLIIDLAIGSYVEYGIVP